MTDEKRESETQEIVKRHREMRRRMERYGGVYLEDLVLGANDGIITSFAVISGSTGGTLGTLVIIVLGFANLLGDGVSMGASNYLAKRSKRDLARSERAMLEWEIEHQPEEKKEELAERIEEQGARGQERREVLETLTRYRRAWLIALMATGLGLEEADGVAWKHGLSTLAAFVVAGFFPLLPYVLGLKSHQFLYATIIAAVTLLGAGALRTLLTGVGWLRSGLEMLLVGSSAAAVAYGVGWVASLVR